VRFWDASALVPTFLEEATTQQVERLADAARREGFAVLGA
jgi:hypothetical protein